MVNVNIRRDILVCLFLVLTTLAVYWQVGDHEFVNFDDDLYVTENYHVQRGLTLENINWAFSFTDKEKTYWHPLTWLSHMLDCQLYGLSPGMHHLTNLVLHIVSTLLLFLVFNRMTGALWRSAFIAALFALHPLNVDSVAWVAERKNLLSTFFWMLTMLAYVRYTERPGIYRYLLTFLVFALGLLAKPMLVTLPLVLLLLDYWPLGRVRFGQSGGEGSIAFRLILEKVPLLALSVVSIFLSSLSLHRAGAVVPMELVPMKLRIANALVSYIKYIGKMIWPENLAVLYPYPHMVPMWQTIGALLLLVCVSVLVVRMMRRMPCLVTGWLWYLGTLVPVIGLVQAGLWPAMADRFTYVPLIGLFVMIAWGVPELVAGWRYRDAGLAAIAAVLLSILMTTTWFQVQNWRNSIVLFKHTLNVTAGNSVVHNNLGEALACEGRMEEAVIHFAEALRIDPAYHKAHNNMGAALRHQGRIEEAITHFQEALRIKPAYAEAHNNLGVALTRRGRVEEAISHFREALRIKPDYADAHYNMGVVLLSRGKAKDAIFHFRQVLRIKPDYAKAHYGLGAVLLSRGMVEEAAAHFREVLRIKPGYAGAHNNLGVALMRQGMVEEAATHFREVLRIKPGYAEAHNNLGVALMRQGKVKEAAVHFREALRIKPDYMEAYKNLQLALNIKKESH